MANTNVPVPLLRPRVGVCELTIETIKTQIEAAETAAAADRRTLSSLVTIILNDWLEANSL
jgi:hypothetical protein